MKGKITKYISVLTAALACNYAYLAQAKNYKELMLTRNGSFYEVKIERVGSSKLTYTNTNHPKWGTIRIPNSYVYAVLRQDGNHIFFNEDGSYISVIENKPNLEGDILFLKSHKFFPVYDVKFVDDGVVYKLSDSPNASLYQIERAKVFMLKKADKTVLLFDDKYGLGKNASIAPPSKWKMPTPRTDIAASTFSPSDSIDTQQLVNSVNAARPYALHDRTTMLEYQFQRGRYQETVNGISFIRQRVADIKMQNGLMVTYVKQLPFDGNHNRTDKVPRDYYDYLFPIELDAKGNYFLTHNIVGDLMLIERRNGYGVLIPADLQPGMHLPCGKMTIRGRSFKGKAMIVETAYRDWYVVNEETMTTSAGTFNCIKLRGRIQVVTNGGKPVVQKIACWLAKDIGIVCYDTLNESSGEKVPLTLCLTRIQK